MQHYQRMACLLEGHTNTRRMGRICVTDQVMQRLMEKPPVKKKITHQSSYRLLKSKTQFSIFFSPYSKLTLVWMDGSVLVIPLDFAKICFSCIVTGCGKIPLYLTVGAFLKNPQSPRPLHDEQNTHAVTKGGTFLNKALPTIS